MRLEDIIIDDEFRDLLCPLTAEQRSGLADGIRADGWLDPIVVWRNHGVLIDGHNRHAIWQEIGGEGPDVVEMKFADRDAVRGWIIRHQLDRRNLDPKQAAMLRGMLHEQRKQPQGGNQNAKKTKCQNDTSISAAETVAADTGVSAITVKRDAAFARAVTKLDADGVLPKAEALKPTAAGGPTRKAIVEAAKAETPEAAKEIIEKPKAKPEPKPSSQARRTPEEVEQYTYALNQANKAIDALRMIGVDHPFRSEAFRVVRDFIS